MTSDITPERVEKLKRQVPPGISGKHWSHHVFWVFQLSAPPDAVFTRHILRCLIADADAREAAELKEPPIPPGPEGVDEGKWKETCSRLAGSNRDGTGTAICLLHKEAAHILAALEVYRPGVEMVPLEAFVASSKSGDWCAIRADAMCSWHPDKLSALAAVRKSVREAMEERNV